MRELNTDELDAVNGGTVLLSRRLYSGTARNGALHTGCQHFYGPVLEQKRENDPQILASGRQDATRLRPEHETLTSAR